MYPSHLVLIDPLKNIALKRQQYVGEFIVSVLEKDVEELKEVDHTKTLLTLLRSKIPLAVNAYLGSTVDYKDVIEESVQANVINDVKNLLPKFLPKAVSDFATTVIQSTIKKALEKTPIVLPHLLQA
ncbi:hypothetical protein Tco_0650925 [Tanacetum coccineum]